jgi:RNA polymerase sigma-70 factor (ECF subfamily)
MQEVAEQSIESGLMARVAKGDVEAMRTLYNEHASSLLALGRAMMRNTAEAEDLVHDAFILARERAARYDAERGSVAGWLITLTRNLGIDRLRAGARRRALVCLRLSNEPVATESAADALLDEAAMRRRVRKALQALPLVQRASLEGAFLEGLSYPELANRDGVPLGTIKSRANRGLATLRRLLENEAIEGADFAA